MNATNPDPAAKDLKEASLRGGLARVLAQASNLLFRVGSIVILARLLEPSDFGLVAMVTAVVGILSIVKDFGLSAAIVQSAAITNDQLSTLFWLNVLVAGMLSGLVLATSPLLVAFYGEPRLLWIAAALAVGFLFNGVAVQHGALLHRQMRFGAMAVIEILSQLVAILVGIIMAILGYGYWALVAMTIAPSVTNAVGVWLVVAWIPGLPRRNAGVGSMVRFGGAVSLNSLAMYVAYNSDKVLLGRMWGAEALGFYGRAYQLMNIPSDSLLSVVGGITFSALSRLQNDASRFRNYFLKGYSLLLAIAVPVVIASGLFAGDVVMVMLGPKWTDAAVILRNLSPAFLVLVLINPLASMLLAKGLAKRILKISLVVVPLTISAYLIGLPYGASGVALAFSVAMIIWVLPHVAWCVRNTSISLGDILAVARQPLISAAVAGVAGATAVLGYDELVAWLSAGTLGTGLWDQFVHNSWQTSLPRLIVACIVMLEPIGSCSCACLGRWGFIESFSILAGFRRTS